MSGTTVRTLLFLVTEDWYFCSHRLGLARAARERGYRVVVATRVSRDGARIEAEGFELRPLRLRRRALGPWGELRSIAELIRLYRAERPDIVHHVALKPVIYGSLAARIARIPHVINAIAGFGFVFASPRLAARLARPLVRAAYRFSFAPRTSRVIVQNREDRQIVLGLGVDAARVALVPGSGVDLARFTPTPEPAGVVTVTMVSRMLRDKGVLELVAAARLLAGEGVAVRIRLVGPPDPDNPGSLSAAELQAFADEGVVAWEGASDDVPAVWASSHVAVLPSYREGLPKSLLEAAACGRPSVSTDVPGCRDVVVDGRTGLLVPAGDAEALARAIQRLVSEPGLRRDMGRAAREDAGRFAEPVVIEQTLDLYASLDHREAAA